MKLIKTDEQLRILIPNVLTTVEGEPTLIEKLYPYLESAEQWAIDTFVPEEIFNEIAESDSLGTNERFRYPLEKLVACHAYMTAIPSLDLVLTPNGFGIVSNQNVAPASRERVEALITSLESQRDAAIESFILRLSSRSDWRESAQGKYFGATMFPFLNLCRRLAIREHLWDSYQQLHERLIKIENVLAETYFSQGQMDVFRQHVINQMRLCHPLEEQVIRTLQSLEMMLVSDMQVHNQSFYDLVNIIREHSDIFLAWHVSETAKLYSPAIFTNKKVSGGYFF